jgi:type I restriction enzyme S subunit
VKPNDVLMSDYLFMYFSRPEFDRYARFNSWGSAREAFSWDEMCDIRLRLPSIDVQKKYAGIFMALGSSEAFRSRLREIAPILIKGSIEEGAG